MSDPVSDAPEGGGSVDPASAPSVFSF